MGLPGVPGSAPSGLCGLLAEGGGGASPSAGQLAITKTFGPEHPLHEGSPQLAGVSFPASLRAEKLKLPEPLDGFPPGWGSDVLREEGEERRVLAGLFSTCSLDSLEK